MSLLSHQCLLLKEDGFRERYPHGWLVWEAGAWNVPDSGEELGATRLPQSDFDDCLPHSDILCFELPSDAEGPLGLGRATENALVVNDATVSREQLSLTWRDGRWQIERLADAADTRVDGEEVAPGAQVTLKDGAQVQVGDVKLTYLTAESFFARVQKHAQMLARAAVSPPKSNAS